MKCTACTSTSDGFAVIPGIGEAGEIRFYCDRCARVHRVKMRYWDARDLDVGGWREKPDLGESFHTLVFSFHDVGRMRREDLEPAMAWLEDLELARALVGADLPVVERIYSALTLPRLRRVRALLESEVTRGEAGAADQKAAREAVVSVLRRL